MRRLVVTPAARSDLIEIGDDIALDNPRRAFSFVDEMEAVFSDIGSHPGRFPRREDIHPGLHAARHGRYLILFEDTGDEIRNVRVIHGARDIPTLFGN